MNSIKSISVCGLGKLGGCIAATYAARGFTVVGIDVDADKIRRVNAGVPPVDEPLLAEMMAEAKGRLRATDDPREAIGTDASFFIPPPRVCPTEVFRTSFC